MLKYMQVYDLSGSYLECFGVAPPRNLSILEIALEIEMHADRNKDVNLLGILKERLSELEDCTLDC